MEMYEGIKRKGSGIGKLWGETSAYSISSKENQ